MLTLYDYIRNGEKEAVKIIDSTTGDTIAVRLAKRDGNQYKLAFQASRKYVIKRFIEGSDSDPYQVGEEPKRHDSTPDAEKLRKIKKQLHAINEEYVGKFDWYKTPAGRAFLEMYKILDIK